MRCFPTCLTRIALLFFLVCLPSCAQVLTQSGVVVPEAGRDVNIPTSGSLSGPTGAPVCRDANGGIDTSGRCTGVTPFVGPRPYIDVTAATYGAIGDGGLEQATGAISAASNQLTISSYVGTWKIGMGLRVDGAGSSGDVLLAHISAINGVF